jgi:hypothetical protein
MIHWVGTPEGYCSRKDEKEDHTVSKYQTKDGGSGTIIYSALANFLGNVNCPRCREAYALAELQKKWKAK